MFYEYQHIGLTEYFTVIRDQNLNFPPHLHRCFELIYLDHGQMTVTVDRTEYTFQAGQALWIFPYQIHSLQCRSSQVTIFLFSPMLLPDLPTDRLPNKPLITPDAAMIARLCASQQRAEQKGLLYLLYATLEKMSSFSARTAAPQGLLERIFRHIDTHFTESCTLADTAAALGYDPSYLSRYFKKQVGISYSAYLTSYRLGQACSRLRSTDDTVLSCAMAAGFSGLRNFNLCFRKQYGISPTAYRKASR